MKLSIKKLTFIQYNYKKINIYVASFEESIYILLNLKDLYVFLFQLLKGQSVNSCIAEYCSFD